MNFLKTIREENPLIHNITNKVVANDVANCTIAVGASPFMADAVEEMEEAASKADALVLNIGTLNNQIVESMLTAGKAANKNNVPVVLDPVGVGATSYRKNMVKQLLNEISFDVIRGNKGEIATLAEAEWKTKGVDSGSGDVSSTDIVKQLAKSEKCIVAISGEQDVISDGDKVITIFNGHEYMSKITGSGCMLSGLIGSFVSISNNNTFEAVQMAHGAFGIAGEKAANRQEVFGNGTFRNALIDGLYNLTSEDITVRYKKKEVS